LWMRWMVGNHDALHHCTAFQTRLEIRLRRRLHFACATNLVAADDFARARDANGFARFDFLPAKTRRSWRKTFLNLEVQNDAGARGDNDARELPARIDKGRSSDDET